MKRYTPDFPEMMRLCENELFRKCAVCYRAMTRPAKL